MPSIRVDAASAALTADGTSAGLITIADTTTWIPGVRAYIRDDVTASIRVVVVKVVSGTQIQLRSLESTEKSKFGFTDMSGYTGAHGHPRISRDQQVVAVNPAFSALQKAGGVTTTNGR